MHVQLIGSLALVTLVDVLANNWRSSKRQLRCLADFETGGAQDDQLVSTNVGNR